VANSATLEVAGSLSRENQLRLDEDNDLTSALQVEKRLTLQPDVGVGPGTAVLPEAPDLDEVGQYLWNVYQRSHTKLDSRGDFTWKDAVAAVRLGLSIRDYVIGGMDPDFRELLFHLGHAMDAAGIDWTILSAYRDDYRQSLAVGYKARVDNSFHGGSVATGGYGHGCAADLAASDGIGASDVVWKWLDGHGEQFGLHRPLRRIDPAHVQPVGVWHEIAATLRNERVGNSREDTSSNAAGADFDAQLPPTSAERSLDVGISEEQFTCVRPPSGDDVKKAEESPSRLRPHATVLRLSSAGRSRLRGWKTAGGARSGQHAPADNARHHVRSKAHFHLAGRSGPPT
jgi:hypothetical protein